MTELTPYQRAVLLKLSKNGAPSLISADEAFTIQPLTSLCRVVQEPLHHAQAYLVHPPPRQLWMACLLAAGIELLHPEPPPRKAPTYGVKRAGLRGGRKRS